MGEMTCDRCSRPVDPYEVDFTVEGESLCADCALEKDGLICVSCQAMTPPPEATHVHTLYAEDRADDCGGPICRKCLPDWKRRHRAWKREQDEVIEMCGRCSAEVKRADLHPLNNGFEVCPPCYEEVPEDLKDFSKKRRSGLRLNPFDSTGFWIGLAMAGGGGLFMYLEVLRRKGSHWVIKNLPDSQIALGILIALGVVLMIKSVVDMFRQGAKE